MRNLPIEGEHQSPQGGGRSTGQPHPGHPTLIIQVDGEAGSALLWRGIGLPALEQRQAQAQRRHSWAQEALGAGLVRAGVSEPGSEQRVGEGRRSTSKSRPLFLKFFSRWLSSLSLSAMMGAPGPLARLCRSVRGRRRGWTYGHGSSRTGEALLTPKLAAHTRLAHSTAVRQGGMPVTRKPRAGRNDHAYRQGSPKLIGSCLTLWGARIAQDFRWLVSPPTT